MLDVSLSDEHTCVVVLLIKITKVKKKTDQQQNLQHIICCSKLSVAAVPKFQNIYTFISLLVS